MPVLSEGVKLAKFRLYIGRHGRPPLVSSVPISFPALLARWKREHSTVPARARLSRYRTGMMGYRPTSRHQLH
jgi:hypothetical protein